MADIKPIETFYNGYRFRSRLEARWAVFFDALGVEYEYEPEGFLLPSGKRYLPDFKVKCWGTRGDKSGPPFDLWIEVKGNMTESDADKIKEFADKYDGPAILLDCDGGLGWEPLALSPRSDYDDHIRRWECPGGASGCGGPVICKYGEEIPDKFFCPRMNYELSLRKEPKTTNRVLIVDKIPAKGNSYSWSGLNAGKPMNGNDIYPFNYFLIDGDYFGAYPAADYKGHFYLWGDDSNYINDEDVQRVEMAYAKARQARFEHGETPYLPFN